MVFEFLSISTCAIYPVHIFIFMFFLFSHKSFS
jgi:hypothetical protein